MVFRGFRLLWIGGVLLSGGAVLDAGVEELPAELLGNEAAPDADWSAILDARIKAGEPLPELPPDKDGPAADASPAELLAYWREDWPWRNKEEPLPEHREKILQAVHLEPEAIYDVLRALPAHDTAAAAVDALLAKLSSATTDQREKLREVRAWVYRQAGLRRDQVIADSADADWELYLWNERPDPTLDALLFREPEVAERLLGEFAAGKNAGLAVVACRLLLERAEANEAGRWRKELKAAAANPALPEEARQIATDALLARDWPGREVWSLEDLKDERLGDPYWFGPPVWADPDHWIPLLTAMLGGPDKHAHDHAVHLLVTLADKPRIDAIRPLLPWLKNEKWAEAAYSDRLRLIQSLDGVPLPECVEGLVELMRHDREGSHLAYAAQALLHYKATSAVPVMKQSLEHCDSDHYRKDIIAAIHGLGGFTTDEIVASLEVHATQAETGKSREEASTSVDLQIGGFFAESLPAGPEVADAISRRAEIVGKDHPALASALRNIGAGSPAPAGFSMLASVLADGTVAEETLASALKRCRKSPWDGKVFQPLLARGGVIRGFAAVLSRDGKAIAAALDSDDVGTQSAVLAAAWLSGDRLDLKRAIQLMKSDDETVADAAGSYLHNSSEPEAWRLLDEELAPWNPEKHEYRGFTGIDRWVRGLHDGLGSLKEVFSLSSYVQGSVRDRWIVLRYANRAIAVFDPGGGRKGTCELSAGQLKRLQDYVTKFRADDLPELTTPINDGIAYAYDHATSGLHRSVYMDNPPTNPDGVEYYVEEFKGSKGVVLYAGLVRSFLDVFAELELKFSYGRDIEILVRREQGEIRSVWKKGDDLRVLAENSRDAPQWRSVSLATKELAGPAAEPAESPYLSARSHLHSGFDVYLDHHFRFPWQVQAGDSTVVHAGTYGDVLGLWRCRRGFEPVLIAEGGFAGELVSDDGKWCVAAKAAGSGWAEPNTAVRINLETKEVTPIALEAADNFDTLAFLAAHGKFLIFRRADSQMFGPGPFTGPEVPEFHLLDAATGALERVTGDFSPYFERSFRPLQSAGASNVFWYSDSANLSGGESYAKVGKYDEKTFKFEVEKAIQGIAFDSDSMWIDEEESMIYAAVNGDLVRMPLDR